MVHTITLYDAPTAAGKPTAHEFRFPGSWDEAKPDHLLAIAKAQLTGKNPTRIKFNLLRELAGIPRTLMARMPAASDLTYEVDTTDRSGPWRPKITSEWRLLPQLDWAFKPAVYEKSLLPAVTLAEISWTGPDDGFERMPLIQWVWCTELLRTFRNCTDPTEQVDALHNLLGALYQPAHCTWSNEPIEEYGAKLAALPVEVKLAAVLNYEAIHSTLPLRYARVFNPTDGGDAPSPEGLFGLAYDAAKTGAFGDYEKVEYQPLHRVLGYMEHNLFSDAQQAARAKRLSEESKSSI